MSLLDRVLGPDNWPEIEVDKPLPYELTIGCSKGDFYIQTNTVSYEQRKIEKQELCVIDVPPSELCLVKCCIDKMHELKLSIRFDEIDLMEEQIYKLRTAFNSGNGISERDIETLSHRIHDEQTRQSLNRFTLSAGQIPATVYHPVEITALTSKLSSKLSMTVNEDMSYNIHYGDQFFHSTADNFRLFKYLSKKLPDALINKEDIDLVELSERYISRKF